MYFKLQPKSSNRKTGPICVISSDMNTCPHSCPLRENGCYGHSIGYIRHRWESLGYEGLDFNELIETIRALPYGLVVRYGEVGDLPGDGRKIDRTRSILLTSLFRARGDAAFTYTHYLSDPQWFGENLETIQSIHVHGNLTVNISTENLDTAAEYCSKGWPTVCTIPDDGTTDWKSNRSWKHKGEQVIVCPAVWREVQCINCGGRKGPLCYRKGQNRPTIISFPSHGPSKRKVNEVVK